MKHAMSAMATAVAMFSASALADFYVSTTGNDGAAGTEAAPFLTVQHAVTAAGSGPAVIHVAAGTYDVTSQTVAGNNAILDITNPIEIVGDPANPGSVVFMYHGTGARHVYMNNANAKLRGVTLQDGYVNVPGANATIEAGLIEDCIIEGAYARTTWGGGNVYMTGGTVNRCIIRYGQMNTSSGNDAAAGVCLRGGVLMNSLLYKNGFIRPDRHRTGDLNYEPLSGSWKTANAPCVLNPNSTAKVINCTVVGNYARSVCGGVWVKKASGSQVVNTAIYLNELETAANAGDIVYSGNGSCYVNCACDEGVTISGGVNCLSGSPLFRDAAAGNYSPASSSSLLCDNGNTSDAAEALTGTDLAGGTRVVGSAPDIGCYELQNTSALKVSVTHSSLHGAAPFVVNVTATATGAVGTPTYKWDFDGDGTTDVTTTQSNASWTYTGAGRFKISLIVEDSGSLNTADYEFEDDVVVTGAVYVSTEGNDTTGTGTEAKPFRTIVHALDSVSEGGTIYVAAGTYEETPASGSSVIPLSAPIAVIGLTGDPKDVVISYSGNSARVLYLDNASARVANVTIEGGCVGSNGGNVSITANGGTLENCIVQNAYCSYWNGAGGNIYMQGGRVSRCVIKAGYVNKYNDDNGTGGSGVMATAGVIENCLIVSNAVASVKPARFSGNDHDGYAPVYLAGSASLVNCTVAANQSRQGCGGVRIKDGATGVTVVNCAIYGNNVTSPSNASDTVYKGAGSQFSYCACDAGITISGGDHCKSGDPNFTAGYAPASSTGILCNAGRDYATTAATSTVDLAGNERVSAGAVDIGCFEYQDTSALIVSVEHSEFTGGAPFEVTVTAHATGALGSAVYKWDFNGDGTYDVTTSQESASWTYNDAGVYTVSLRVEDTGSSRTVELTLDDQVVTLNAIYVAKNGNDTTGDGSEANPFLTVARAVQFAGSSRTTIYVGDGVYDETADSASNAITLSAPIEIVGRSGSPNRVTLKCSTAQVRVLYLDHAEARVANVTIDGGLLGSNGGNVSITANGGTLENCIVQNGYTSYWNGGGGNIYMQGGRVSRCTIKAGFANHDSLQTGGNGSGVMAKAGVIENCLIVSNGVDAVKSSRINGNNHDGHCPVFLEGTASMVNCTITANRSRIGCGGVYIKDGATGVSVVNCAIFGNTVDTPDNASAKVYKGAGSQFSYCACDSGVTISGGDHCKSGNPGFVDAAAGNYRIAQEGTLLCDAGRSYAATPATSSVDLSGFPRVSGNAVDIGCYEYHQGVDLDVSFTYEQSSPGAPATVTFTATADGVTAAATYNWDFDGDGVYDIVGFSPVLVHEFTDRGTYPVKLRVIDSQLGTMGDAELASPLTLSGTLYVDSSAAAGGNGTENAPFRTLAEAVADLTSHDVVLFRGGDGRSYEFGDGTDATVIDKSDVTFGKWGDAVPEFTAKGTSQTVTDAGGLIRVAAANVTFRDLAFAPGSAAAGALPVFGIEAANTAFENCSFRLADHISAESASAGVIRVKDNRASAASGLRIAGCSFKEFFNPKSDAAHKVIVVGNNATVTGCKFTDCANIVSVCQTGIEGFNFSSNRVANTQNTATSGNKAGSLMQVGANAFGTLATVERNVFANEYITGGYVIFTTANQGSFTGGLRAANNTVVGYDAFMNSASSSDGKLTFANNLVSGALFVTAKSSPPYAATSEFYGNAVYGGSVFSAPNGFNPASNGAFAGDNTILTAAPTFVSHDIDSAKFYAPADGANAWVHSGTQGADGDAGALVGAYEPRRSPTFIAITGPAQFKASDWRVTALDPSHLLIQYDCNSREHREFKLSDAALAQTGWKFDELYSAAVDAAQSDRAGMERSLRNQDLRVTGNGISGYGFWKMPIGQSHYPKGNGRDYTSAHAEILYNAYVTLSRPLTAGDESVIVLPGGEKTVFTYDPEVPSPIFKVNQVGYSPRAAQRFVYMGCWLGTLGAMPAPANRAFQLVNADTGATVLSGTFVKRMNDSTYSGVPLEGEETLEADISSCTTPGDYYVRVPGVGRSMNFRISDQAIGDQFAVHMLGMYMQRCGCAKEEPYTHWTEAACHSNVWRGVHSPDGAGYTDLNGNDIWPDQFSIIDANMPYYTEQMHLPGGWHDAADYDRRIFHIRISGDFAAVYMMKPGNFTDGQLAIPENSNGIPDILDEAIWGLRHILGSQRSDGGVSTWFETTRHPDPKTQELPSEDSLVYAMSEPTRDSTLEYVGNAALLARALRLAGTPAALEWADRFQTSAIKGWQFGTGPRPARKQIKSYGDNHETVSIYFRDPADVDPTYYVKAAVNLYELTGDASYLSGITSTVEHNFEVKINQNDWKLSPLALAEIGFSSDDVPVLSQLKTYYRGRAVFNADQIVSQVANSMAYRMPWYGSNNININQMMWGAVVPLRRALTLCSAHFLTGDDKYLEAAYLACDYQSGCNPNGSTWTSGLGTVYPVAFLNIHSVADSVGEFIPGITPYRNVFNQQYTARNIVWGDNPAEADLQPYMRRWCNIEGQTVSSSEYTVWETIAPCAAATGYLMAPASTPNLNWKQPAAKLSDLPGYWALP